MPRPPLSFRLVPADRRTLDALLQGGVQPVRVELRSLAVLALDRGERADRRDRRAAVPASGA